MSPKLDANLKSPSQPSLENYINRELSWLEFNSRVLELARQQDLPLLERLKFLAITSSNLDEFFMVRVGGLQLQREAGVASTDLSGMTVQDQLEAIGDRTRSMIQTQYQCFLQEIEPSLAAAGIGRVHMASAGVRHLDTAERMFEEEIFSVLTPLNVSPFEPFPSLNNRELHLCVQLVNNPEASLAAGLEELHRQPGNKADSGPAQPQEAFNYKIIPLGRVLPRVIALASDSGHAYVLIEDLVSHFAQRFFPSERIVAKAIFRVIRNADVNIQEDGAADLLHGMKELLQQRRVSAYVRLEMAENAPAEMTEFLRRAMRVHPFRITQTPEPLDLSSLMSLASLEGYDHLRDKPWAPQRSPQIDPTQSMFATLAERDVILFHPYQSFEPVVRLIEEAADDPDVLAIKQTLYRTSRKSPIVRALCKAAEQGKYVTVVVELKARFDEARNINWANELEKAGVQVIYGVKHLKTHAKVCVIVRREPQGTVRYTHFSTGNYNESTARLYTDVSLLTCNTELGADASAFFNAVTGYSQPQKFAAIEAAPLGLRKRLLSLIESEIKRQRDGSQTGITVKVNALVDPQLIQALYRASQAGIQVRLNVRGVCCLRPGVSGLSENITVVSVVGRFLEHARIIYFCHGGDDLVFISSADWMPRNLDRRVELLVPVENAAGKRACMTALEGYFRDNRNAWVLQSDGTYLRRQPEGADEPFQAQQVQYQSAVEALKEAERMRTTMFEPHQPIAQQMD